MTDDIKVAAVIPARYGSTRFPAKVLALLCGKPMIEHVYNLAQKTQVNKVLVATDNPKVADAVANFGGTAIMTSETHQSGTDRIYEAITKNNEDFDIIINIQGDEPLLPPNVIDELIDVMKNNKDLSMATVAVPGSREDLNNPNKVKVVFDKNNHALYFSRSMVPYLREGGEDAGVYLHWGIYAYRYEALKKFVSLPVGRLENCEKLEQLRAMENGMKIYVLISNLTSVGVDTPEDLIIAERKMKEKNEYCKI